MVSQLRLCLVLVVAALWPVVSGAQLHGPSVDALWGQTEGMHAESGLIREITRIFISERQMAGSTSRITTERPGSALLG